MRKCRLCNIEKSLDSFSVRDKTKGTRRTECKPCLNAIRKSNPNYGQWHKLNRSRVQSYMREYDLQRKYGINVEQYNTLLTKQQFKCAICKTKNFKGKGKKLHVDHCHNTGNIRALLCNSCNVGLGAFMDNVSTLLAAADYLQKHGTTK